MSPSHRDRARAEWAAARACVRERRAGPALAAVHYGRAFGALLARDARLPAPSEWGRLARGDAPDPPAVGLAARADDLEQLARGIGAADRDTRRLLRRLDRALQQTLGQLRRGRLAWRVGLGLAVPLLLVAALLLSRQGGVGREGFHGAYYPRRGFEGEPQVRHDRRIDFSWLARAPLSGLPRDQFSVRWDACFELEAPARITFRVGSDDGSRVLLDGDLIVDNWRDQGGNWAEQTVEVPAGVHHLRVEYYERGGDALVVFEARRDGRPVGSDFMRLPEVVDPEVRCAAP